MPCQVLLCQPFVHLTEVKFKPRFSFVNCADFPRVLHASRCAYDLWRYCICFILDPSFNVTQMFCIFSSRVLYIKNMRDPRRVSMKWFCIKKCKKTTEIEITVEIYTQDLVQNRSYYFYIFNDSFVFLVNNFFVRENLTFGQPKSERYSSNGQVE